MQQPPYLWAPFLFSHSRFLSLCLYFMSPCYHIVFDRGLICIFCLLFSNSDFCDRFIVILHQFKIALHDFLCIILCVVIVLSCVSAFHVVLSPFLTVLRAIVTTCHLVDFPTKNVNSRFKRKLMPRGLGWWRVCSVIPPRGLWLQSVRLQKKKSRLSTQSICLR